MDKKGQISIGALIVLFVGIVVALVLFQSAAIFTGQSTNTNSLVNKTFAAPAAVNGTIDLTGQELLDTPTVYNTSNSSQSLVAGNNYTIAEGISTLDGLKRIRFKLLDGASNFAGKNINVSYSYGAEGYADDAGARAIIPLILILGAIAIAVFVLVPTLRDGLLDMMGR